MFISPVPFSADDELPDLEDVDVSELTEVIKPAEQKVGNDGPNYISILLVPIYVLQSSGCI